MPYASRARAVAIALKRSSRAKDAANALKRLITHVVGLAVSSVKSVGKSVTRLFSTGNTAELALGVAIGQGANSLLDAFSAGIFTPLLGAFFAIFDRPPA